MSEKTTRIRRAKHDSQNRYFALSRLTAQEKELTYEALGMLVYLLSKPDDWEVQPKDLQRKGCGRDKVYRILTELKDARYIQAEEQSRESGKFGDLEYLVYEQPYTEKPDTANTDTVEGKPPHTDSPYPANPDSTEYRVLESTESNTRTELKDSTPDGVGSQSFPENEVAGNAEPQKVEEQQPAPQAGGELKPTSIVEGNAPNGETLPDPNPQELRAAPLSQPAGQGDPPPRAKNPLQEAVAYAFNIQPGGYAGQIISQLIGTAKKGERKEWAITDPPMTPEEIIGCRLWYKTDKRYKEQKALPGTAETLHDRVLEFRSTNTYPQFVIEGTKHLKQLLGVKDDPAQADDVDEFDWTEVDREWSAEIKQAAAKRIIPDYVQNGRSGGVK